MTSNRRDFLLKTAKLSGAGILANSLPHLGLLGEARGATGVSPTAAPPPDVLPDAVSRPSSLGLDPRIWTWHKTPMADGAMPANYYEASLAPWQEFAPLKSDDTCDVVVIGGGLLGASTALHMAEAGLDVVLVEKDSIGSGASGRNGGQVTPGLARWEAETFLEKFSPDEAKRAWRFASIEAAQLIDSLSERYGFKCERKFGHLTVANNPGHMGSLVANADARRELGDDAVHIMGPLELEEQHVRSKIYHGAALDHIGGHVHPLALLRGLVHGFTTLGGRVHERTEVLEIRPESGFKTVVTKGGRLRARKAVVLAVHSATYKFLPGSSTTMPFYTYVSVTPPLKGNIRDLLPTDLPVYDTQLQIDYYRGVKNNRLLFGGQGTGISLSKRDVNDYLLGRIKTVFPQIENPELEYSWGGITDLTLDGATDARRSEESVPVYLVHGWSGHGVAQTVRIGKAISDDLTRHNNDYEMLTSLEHVSIPFGRFLSPVAIPIVKGALSVRNALDPGDVIAF